MSEQTLVSVVIVNFNAGDLLVQCVQSVLSSTHPVEVVVVDNASTDHSLQALQKVTSGDARVRILSKSTNTGFASANNMGITATKSDMLLFLNPDCLVGKRTLERVANALHAEPRAGMAGCLILNPDGSMQKACRRLIPTPWSSLVRIIGLTRVNKIGSSFDTMDEPLQGAPQIVEAISGAFMLVRRAAIDRVGPMDEGYFVHCEDLDWCMRFSECGFKILFVSDAIAVHYQGTCSANSPVRVTWHMHKGMTRFYRKFFRGRYAFPLTCTVFLGVWCRCLILMMRNSVSGAPKSSFHGHQTETLPSVGQSFSQTLLSESDRERVVVVGATSVIGDYLIGLLIEAGYEVLAISRHVIPYRRCGHVTWLRSDLTDRSHDPFPGQASKLVHLAPIWILPQYIDQAAREGIRRIVAFSSTSIFTKADSNDQNESRVVNLLTQGEMQTTARAHAHAIKLTLFRPTMVYSDDTDKTVGRLRSFVDRFGFFPLVGEGRGLRQPVHAEDLADACLAVMDNPVTFGKEYELCGGQTLSYRELVTVIFQGLGKKPVLVRVPLKVVKIGLQILALLPGFRDLSPAMADRMPRDLCFDHSAARDDFGYRPRAFSLDADAPQRPSDSQSEGTASGHNVAQHGSASEPKRGSPMVASINGHEGGGRAH